MKKIFFLILYFQIFSIFGQELNKEELSDILSIYYINRYEAKIQNKTSFDLIVHGYDKDLQIPASSFIIVYNKVQLKLNSYTKYRRYRFDDLWYGNPITVSFPKNGLTPVLEKLKNETNALINNLYKKNTNIKNNNKQIDFLSGMVDSMEANPNTLVYEYKDGFGNSYQREESTGEYFARQGSALIMKSLAQMYLSTEKKKVLTKAELEFEVNKIKSTYLSEVERLKRKFEDYKLHKENKEFEAFIDGRRGRHSLTSVIDFTYTNDFFGQSSEVVEKTDSYDFSLALIKELNIGYSVFTRPYLVYAINKNSLNFLNYRPNNNPLAVEVQDNRFSTFEDEGNIANYWSRKIGFRQIFTGRSKRLYAGFQYLINLSKEPELRTNFGFDKFNENTKLVLNKDSFLNNSASRIFLGYHLGNRRIWSVYFNISAFNNNFTIEEDFKLATINEIDNIAEISDPIVKDELEVSFGFGISFSLSN